MLTNQEILADMIISAREQKGYSQRKLAATIGISNSELSNLENAKRLKPNVEILKKISETLNLDYEEMLEAIGYIKSDYDFKDNTSLLDEKERQYIVNAVVSQWTTETDNNISIDLSDKDKIYQMLFSKSDEALKQKSLKDMYPNGYNKFLQIASMSQAKKEKFLDYMDLFLKYEKEDGDNSEGKC